MKEFTEFINMFPERTITYTELEVNETAFSEHSRLF